MLYIFPNTAKSQAWFPDFVIGISIFVIGISIFAYYSALGEDMDSSLQGLVNDARAVSSYLVEEGLPINWTEEEVIIIGLANSEGRVSMSKVQSLLDIPYSTARTLLNTKYDFFIYFTDSTGCFIRLNGGEYGYGHQDADLKDAGSSSSCLLENAKNMTLNLSDVAPKKLIKIERIAVFNGTVAKMSLHEWSR